MAKRQSKKQASQVEVNPPQESLANNMDHPPGALGLRTHHGWTPGKGNILEAKTLNATPFRTLFEALKAMITEANLVFSENGLRMAAIDTKQNAFVHLSIPSSSFELYHCEERLVLGVDIPVVQKIIKTAKLGDTLSFIVHEDSRDKLRICIENAERLSKGVYPIPLRSLAEYKVRDALTFREAPPEIASAEFLGYCRNMVTLGSTRVEIQYLGDELNFIALDGNPPARYTIKLNRPAPKNDSEPEKTPELARGVFLLQFLQHVTKATALSQRVALYIQPTDPLLICEYSIGNLGTLKYALKGK